MSHCSRTMSVSIVIVCMIFVFMHNYIIWEKIPIISRDRLFKYTLVHTNIDKTKYIFNKEYTFSLYSLSLSSPSFSSLPPSSSKICRYGLLVGVCNENSCQYYHITATRNRENAQFVSTDPFCDYRQPKHRRSISVRWFCALCQARSGKKIRICRRNLHIPVCTSSANVVVSRSRPSYPHKIRSVEYCVMSWTLRKN